VCARTVAGKVSCWGAAGNGQLGTGSFSLQNSPQAVDFGSTSVPLAARDIVAKANGTCAFMTDGSLYCWGDNGHGQLGLGAPYTDGLVPTELPVPLN
jgi:alpha-tubulin suppressor-like RCC1 family protein